MDEIINRLTVIIPDIKFAKGSSFCWSPNNRTINYTKTKTSGDADTWSLLHEAAHALLGHKDYDSDVKLVLLEAEAWEKAKAIAQQLDLSIDDNHIQDCLDTYRDWLHQRSTCPRCGVVCLQVSTNQYGCHNCLCTWSVSSARFCRPYRMAKQHTKKPSIKPKALTTTFS